MGGEGGKKEGAHAEVKLCQGCKSVAQENSLFPETSGTVCWSSVGHHHGQYIQYLSVASCSISTINQGGPATYLSVWSLSDLSRAAP